MRIAVIECAAVMRTHHKKARGLSVKAREESVQESSSSCRLRFDNHRACQIRGQIKFQVLIEAVKGVEHFF